MKIIYDGSLRCWKCGGGGVWKIGATPKEAVENWRSLGYSLKTAWRLARKTL